MKEEWLLNDAAVPVTCETVTALLVEIKRLIDVVGGMALAQQETHWDALAEKQLTALKRDMQVSLEDAAVRAAHKVMAEFEREALAQPPQHPWVGLTDEEIKEIVGPWGNTPIKGYTRKLFDQIESKLKEKNT